MTYAMLSDRGCNQSSSRSFVRHVDMEAADYWEYLDLGEQTPMRRRWG
jgi:hypothetical protein